MRYHTLGTRISPDIFAIKIHIHVYHNLLSLIYVRYVDLLGASPCTTVHPVICKFVPNLF